MKFIVIKIGGSTLSDMHPSIINNIKHLRSNNIYPIIVHGGGPLLMMHYQTSKSSHTLLMA